MDAICVPQKEIDGKNIFANIVKCKTVSQIASHMVVTTSLNKEQRKYTVW